MKPLWNDLRPRLGAIGAFSFFINLLFLAPAIFMLQVFDWVIPSNSRETPPVENAIVARTARAAHALRILES